MSWEMPLPGEMVVQASLDELYLWPNRELQGRVTGRIGRGQTAMVVGRCGTVVLVLYGGCCLGWTQGGWFRGMVWR